MKDEYTTNSQYLAFELGNERVKLFRASRIFLSPLAVSPRRSTSHRTGCACEARLTQSPGQTALQTQANSSQVTKSKRTSEGGQTVVPRRGDSQENFSIVWLRPRSHITIAKQLGESWPRWPNGSSWAKIWAWSKSSQLDPTPANSRQLQPTQDTCVAKRYPTPSKLKTWLELAWVGGTVWPGLHSGLIRKFPVKLFPICTKTLALRYISEPEEKSWFVFAYIHAFWWLIHISRRTILCTLYTTRSETQKPFVVNCAGLLVALEVINNLNCAVVGRADASEYYLVSVRDHYLY